MLVSNIASSKSVKSNRKKRRSKLMKAACAGLLSAGLAASNSAPANADVTFNESSIGDFGDTLSAADDVPDRTCTLFGVQDLPNEDSDDYFRWDDLNAGTDAIFDGSPSNGGIFEVFDSGGTSLSAQQFGDFTNLSVTVPTDGILVGAMTYSGEGAGGAYSLGLEASFVPEPNSGALLALGAAGLLGRRRRRTA